MREVFCRCGMPRFYFRQNRQQGRSAGECDQLNGLSYGRLHRYHNLTFPTIHLKGLNKSHFLCETTIHPPHLSPSMLAGRLDQLKLTSKRTIDTYCMRNLCEARHSLKRHRTRCRPQVGSESTGGGVSCPEAEQRAKVDTRLCRLTNPCN